jgi:hypothetical protein
VTDFEPQQPGMPGQTGQPTRRRLIHRASARLRQVPWQRLRPRTRRGAGTLLAVLMGIVWFSTGGELQAGMDTWDRNTILDAIRFVESSGRESPPDGDNGKAIGQYQIHEVYWFDANEFDMNLGGRYQDCRKRTYAERVIDAYMRRHAKQAWANGDGETIARIHNGGPKGHHKTATEGYWQRVRQRLPAPRKSFVN